MKIKAFYGALLSVALAFATLVGIASPANAATTDVTSSTWNLKSNSAASSVTDFTAGKVWRFSGTGVEEGSSIRYNTAVTGANGIAVDAVQITHTNCYGNGATITAVSASGGSVTYTTNRPHNLTVGMYVTISGMTPAGYNVTAQKITAVPSDKTFTLVNATTAAATVYGTLANAYPGITGISKSGTTYTITTNVAHKLVAQTSATLKGLTGGDASYTTAFTAAQSIVSVIDSTNFTVTNATATTGTAPTGGYLALDACPTLASWDSTATDNVFDSQTKTPNTAGYKNNGITFSWEFYEHGTYTGPGTGTPITLQNLWMSVADIDDSTANNGTPQFAEFSGFQNYSLSKATAAATSCSLPAAVNITGASISGSNVTFTTDARLTTSGGLFVAANTPITIRGVTPSSLNGAELTVASATTSAPYTITVNNMSNPGAYVSGGSVIWNPSAVANNAVSNPRCDNSNLNVNNVPGTNLVRFANVVDDAGSNDPKDFAATFYQAVSKVDVKLGSVGINGSSIFALSFGPPATNVAAGSVGWGANGEYKYSNSYNTPPTESNLPTINVSNGVAYTIQSADFGTYYDFDGNPFTKVKIVSLPTSGKMQVKIAGTWTDMAINGTTNIINVSDIVAGNLRFTGSANATFTYQVNDSLDYSTTYTGTIAVASLTQTITFTNPGTKLTTDAAITNAASASSGLTVTLTSATTGVCTVSGTTITLTGTVGTCTVTASQAGGGGYASAQNVTQSFSVNDNSKTGQVITFAKPADQVYSSGKTVSVPATTSASGLQVTLVSNDTSVCTVSGATSPFTVTLVAKGTCSLTASQAGDGTRFAAASVSQTFNVTGAQYTLTFDGNGSDGGSVPSAVVSADTWQVVGNTGSLTKSGFTFSGWTDNSDGTGSTYQSGDFITLAANKTIYAKWTAASYTITYADGGSTGGSLPSNTTGSGSVTLALNTGSLVKSGYYFNGWTIAATNYSAGGSYTLSGNVTATARWSQYTVTYDANGATSGSIPSATLGYGSTALASNSGTLAKTGYYFDGWTIAASSYAAGSNYTISGDVTAYANWSQYTVTYAGNGNTSGSVPSATGGNGSVTLASNTGTLAKTGYYFDGWTIGATSYAAGDSYTLSSNVTATAKWSQYTVTYDANGATSGSIPSPTLGYGTTTMATNTGLLAKRGYTFGGWTIGGTSVAAGGSYNITGNVTATAVWTQYTITYAGNGNTSGSVPANTGGSGSVTLATNTGSLAKTGYYFNGWTIAATNYSAGGAYTLSGNVTATARWSQYTITYDGNGNDGGSVPTATKGYLTVSLASNTGLLSKTGYDFAGWTIGATDYSEGAGYSLTGDVTATAKWTLSAFHITYTDSHATSGSVPSATGGSGNVSIAGKGTLNYPNYYFAGWDINGSVYAPGDSYNLTADVTAVATWAQYNLSYGDDYADSGYNPGDTVGYGLVTISGNDNNLGRTGYYFDGWDINGVHYAVGETYDLQGLTHATPHWSQFTLTYDTNGANQSISAVNGVGSTLLDDGLTLTKNDLVVGNTTTSYVFGGWTIGSTNYNGGDGYSLVADATATAIWNAVVVSVYTVTYDGNGADSGSVSPDTGQSITVSDHGTLVRAGYTFGGWTWAGNTYHQGDSYSFPTNADVTFTAIWDPIVYTLSFADGGATAGSAPSSEISTAGSSVSFPDQGTLVKPGYSFGGWDILGVTHSAGEKGYVPTGNETATAIWTPIVYHFVYDGNGSDGGSVPIGFDGYGDVTVVGNTGNLTNGSKVFGGWVIDGVTHLPGARVSLTSGDVTAYALWVDNVYQLSYQDDGSATSGTAPASVSGYGMVELAGNGGSLVWEGHHVDGWMIGGTLYALGADVDLKTADLVATAHWAIDQITITYTNLGADSGVGPGVQTGDYFTNASLFLPGDLVKNGYVQTGWLIEGNVWDLYDNGVLLLHNMVADPVWTPIVHTVTFDCTVSTSGTCPSSLDSSAGSEIVLPDAGDLANYGYTFGGWLINGVEHGAGEHYVPSGDETATPIWNAIVYHVHYVGNGNTSGSAPADDDSVAFAGVALAGKGSLAKTGYTFGGWSIGGSIYSAGDNYIPLSGDVTAQAVWNAIVYRVTYLGGGNTGGTLPGRATSTALSAVVLAGKGNLVRTGYTFGGWSIAGTTYSPGASFVPDSNVNATAVWNAIVYTVTYLGGGNTGGSLPANGVSTALSAVVLAGKGTLVRAGYAFGGWSIGGTTYDAGVSFVPDSNVEATAVWNAIVYTVTYLGGGNTGGSLPANGVSTALSAVVLAGKGTLVRAGYTFGGWSIGGTTYDPGVSYVPGSNVNATAVWNAIVYSVTYLGNGNDGGSVPANGVSTAGSAVTLAGPGNLSRSGFTFGGWSIGGTTYQPNTSFIPGTNVTATAVWINAGAKTITYSNTGATSGSAPAATSGLGNVLLAGNTGNLAKVGFTFGGWKINGTVYAAGGSFNLNANAIATPVWNPIVYVLTFDGNGNDGGSVPAVISGYGRVTLSANTGSLTRYGYAFAGWNISGTTFAAGSGFNLTSGNVTAKAIWNQLVYNASFAANGANGTLPSTILGFGSVTLPSAGNLAKLGFAFGGWSYAGVTYPAGSTFSLTSGNVILQAVWTPIVYNLTFALNGGSGTTPGAISGFGTKVLPTAIAFNRVGFAFGGWSDGSATYEAGGRYSLTNGDQLLTATWTPIVYNLTYSAKDADGGNAPATDSGFGTKNIAGAGALSRYGYAFVGWRIAGATYAPGDSFSLISGDASASAVWQKLAYSITYIAPDASSGSVAALSGYGTVKLSDGGNLVRTGFKLSGWSISNVLYPLGSNYSLNGGNVTASAVWTPIVYVITYGNNNATGGTAPVASSGYGTITIPASNLTRTGYQLTGWRIDGQTYPIGASYSLTSGSFTATPVWTAIVLTLTFDSNGATGAVPTAISGFGSVTLPSAGKLSLPGFVFAGWQVANTTYSVGDTYTLTDANVTAYAQWNAVVFTVSFSIPGATSGDAPASIQGWGDIELPKASGFKRLGYDFAGWKVGDGVFQPGQTISVRRSDVVARATWQTQIVYKEFWGFAPGSPLLTSDMKSQISSWIKANPGFTVADCVGYTMGPTVLPADKTLATNRAQYTCAYVNNTFPRLDANGKWGGNDLVVGDPIRRVRITLHN